MSAEEQVSQLSREVGELKSTVRNVDFKVDELRNGAAELRIGIAELTKAMTAVVKLEVKHDAVAAQNSTLRDRIELLEKKADVGHRELDKRVDALEAQMPALNETRQWAMRMAGTVLGVVLVAVVGLVVYSK